MYCYHAQMWGGSPLFFAYVAAVVSSLYLLEATGVVTMICTTTMLL